MTTSEEAELTSRISLLQPDLFWVGLSTPKQEKFMAAYSQKLNARIFLGVGAAFDFHAGRLAQAPVWMQHSGLEWSFRLAREPRRLWKRYLKNNPLFLIRAFCQLTHLKAFPLD
jgi:N-acetylglucosaminyldiphosphoundecaprenol N-acetyl-beta-D-mannosaminyltransferase